MKKRDLNKIRKNLPKHWKEELSVQSNRSTSLVEKVMLGIRKNVLIVQLSITLCTLSDEIKKELYQKLKED
ncbi:hypothetical protein [Pedobacter gandavensis]|uniref:XRE family transcriptional regulator n=1 Tax=Pedobacter gandavensis TaxID=2679963 RepID=A0ABR6EV50_9SPHI|nr:hypothetical protein [Pedobacter gandavensis]MBB2149147.1 hypothetical protein [Pedobacter gandavensis]